MKNVLLILLLGVSAQIQGQGYDSLATKSVKIDLVNFIHPFPAVLLSFEHRLHGSIYLHHEGGPVINLRDERNDPISGFKLREEIRSYLSSWNNNDFYLAFDVRYSQENIEKMLTLGYMCETNIGGCLFYRGEPGKYYKELLAFDLRVGLRHSIFPFFFEYDIGYGYGNHNIWLGKANIPPNYEVRNRDPYFLLSYDWKFLLSFRVKFGYYLR